jgi:octaprenyl-diphosphate synthase
MAFQLIDDVLDFTARENVLGKPVGGDLREGKVTLPLIYALADCNPEQRALVQTVLNERSYANATFASILELARRSGGIDRAEYFADRSRAIMAAFPDCPAQRALSAVTDMVTERDF